jgi:hypothetical protein
VSSENKDKAKRKAPPHAWRPGQSGNPGGRPKASEAQKLAAELRAQLQPDIVNLLWGIASDVGAETRDRITAAKALLEESDVTVKGAGEGGALVVVVKKLSTEDEV